MLRLVRKPFNLTNVCTSAVLSVAPKPRQGHSSFDPIVSVARPLSKRLIQTPSSKEAIDCHMPFGSWVKPIVSGLGSMHIEMQSVTTSSRNLVGRKKQSLTRFCDITLAQRRSYSVAVQKETGVIDITQRSYPTDLVHGLLSAHCASETGKEAGKSKIKVGDGVVFREDSPLNRMFQTIGLNSYLSNWKVYEVIEDAQTGYLGIIYENRKAKQVVLAHRSTNFALGLITGSILKQSGVQTDLESVVMGRIVTHQAYGYVATHKAIEFAKTSKNTLSITGHSLGAWLAQLSVYYCDRDLNFKNVKAITFDGPGVLEMMQQMSASEIRGAGTTFNRNELDIVTYFSAPNIVNCTNKHPGIAFTLPLKVGKASIPEWLTKLVGEKNENALVTTLGHSIEYILMHFNATTGFPDSDKYKRVVKWPSITHREYGHVEQALLQKHAQEILGDGSLLSKIGAKFGLNITSKVFGPQTTTLGSLYYFLRDFKNGKINPDQFWKVHEYLDKEQSYAAVTQDKLEDFELLYRGQYKVKEVNEHEREVTDNIDRYLKNIKLYEAEILKASESILREGLASLVKLYEYKRSNNIIAIKEQHRAVTIPQLRDKMRILLSECQGELDKCIDSARKSVVELNSNIPLSRNKSFVRREEQFKEVAKLHSENQVVTVSGVGGVGKSVFAAEYGYINQEQGSIVRWIYGEKRLEESYRDIARELDIVVDNKDDIRVITNKVCAKLATMRSCLIILDNVESYEDVRNYLTGLPKNVRIVITTRRLHFSKDYPEVVLTPFTKEQGLGFVIRALNVAEERVQKLLDAVGKLPIRLDKAVAYIADKTNLTSIEEFILKYEKLKTNNDEFHALMEIILEKVRGKVWNVLHWSAYLDPDFVPIKLFEHLGLSLAELQGITKFLEKSSLAEVVTNSDGEHGVRVHRFVQTEVREYAKLHGDIIKKEKEVLEELVKCLTTLIPDVDDIATSVNWHLVLLYSSSAAFLLKYIIGNQLLSTNEYTADICSKLGLYCVCARGTYKEALVWFKQALEMYKTIYPGNHSVVANTLNNIGNTYLQLKEPHKGLDFYMQVLEMLKALYGNNHPYIVALLINIGSAYRELGEPRKSLDYCNQALEMLDKALDKSNPRNVVHAFGNIGNAYGDLGELHKSLDYYNRALEVYKILYEGSRHPDVAIILSNIGHIYRKLGELHKSLDYYNQALEMYKILYEGSHLDIVHVCTNIGITYEKLEDKEKALDLYKQAYKMQVELFGVDDELVKFLKVHIEQIDKDYFSKK